MLVLGGSWLACGRLGRTLVLPRTAVLVPLSCLVPLGYVAEALAGKNIVATGRQ
jgi:hypothetical protein